MTMIQLMKRSLPRKCQLSCLMRRWSMNELSKLKQYKWWKWVNLSRQFDFWYFCLLLRRRMRLGKLINSGNLMNLMRRKLNGNSMSDRGIRYGKYRRRLMMMSRYRIKMIVRSMRLWYSNNILRYERIGLNIRIINRWDDNYQLRTNYPHVYHFLNFYRSSL